MKEMLCALQQPRAPRHGLIIGQAPSSSTDVSQPPLCGKAEKRLAQLAGLGDDTSLLWARFDRMNLLKRFPGRQDDHLPPTEQRCTDAGNHQSTHRYRQVLKEYDVHGDFGSRLPETVRILRPRKKMKRKTSKGDKFPVNEAAQTMPRLLDQIYAGGRRRLIVLLGLGVARAFGMQSPRLFDRWSCGCTLVIVLPHPSGVSHFWNTVANREKAASELQSAIASSRVYHDSPYFDAKTKTSPYFEKRDGSRDTVNSGNTSPRPPPKLGESALTEE